MKHLLCLTCLLSGPLSAHPRTYTDVTLDTPEGETQITYSLPEPLPREGAPCLLIIDGLKTGREALQLAGNADPYALIAFEYPPRVQVMWEPQALLHPSKTRQAILGIPQQVVNVVRWIEGQSWWDGKPVSIMGLSYGAAFVPAIYHTATEQGVQLGPGILAYGGAGLQALFSANLPVNRWIRRPLSFLLSWILHPIEPALHTPYMKGDFLIIYGAHDKRIPLAATKKLAELVPEPKTVVELDAGHLEPEEPEPLGETIRISKAWLNQRRLGHVVN